jgi:hypothetical protein
MYKYRSSEESKSLRIGVESSIAYKNSLLEDVHNLTASQKRNFTRTFEHTNNATQMLPRHFTRQMIRKFTFGVRTCIIFDTIFNQVQIMHRYRMRKLRMCISCFVFHNNE